MFGSKASVNHRHCVCVSCRLYSYIQTYIRTLGCSLRTPLAGEVCSRDAPTHDTHTDATVDSSCSLLAWRYARTRSHRPLVSCINYLQRFDSNLLLLVPVDFLLAVVVVADAGIQFIVCALSPLKRFAQRVSVCFRCFFIFFTFTELTSLFHKHLFLFIFFNTNASPLCKWLNLNPCKVRGALSNYLNKIFTCILGVFMDHEN